MSQRYLPEVNRRYAIMDNRDSCFKERVGSDVSHWQAPTNLAEKREKLRTAIRSFNLLIHICGALGRSD